MPYLYMLFKKPLARKRGVKGILLLLTRSTELTRTVNVTMTQAKILYILRIEIRLNSKHYLCVSIFVFLSILSKYTNILSLLNICATQYLIYYQVRVLLQHVFVNKMAVAALRF